MIAKKFHFALKAEFKPAAKLFPHHRRARDHECRHAARHRENREQRRRKNPVRGAGFAREKQLDPEP